MRRVRMMVMEEKQTFLGLPEQLPCLLDPRPHSPMRLRGMKGQHECQVRQHVASGDRGTGWDSLLSASQPWLAWRKPWLAVLRNDS